MFDRVADRLLCDAINMRRHHVVMHQNRPFADEKARDMENAFCFERQFLQCRFQTAGIEIDRLQAVRQRAGMAD